MLVAATRGDQPPSRRENEYPDGDRER